jgi:hypothetical protein
MDACSLAYIFKLHHGLKVCCACPCRALDGWLCQIPHSNQDTQPSMESYHGVLKHWLMRYQAPY